MVDLRRFSLGSEWSVQQPKVSTNDILMLCPHLIPSHHIPFAPVVVHDEGLPIRGRQHTVRAVQEQREGRLQEPQREFGSLAHQNQLREHRLTARNDGEISKEPPVFRDNLLGPIHRSEMADRVIV